MNYETNPNAVQFGGDHYNRAGDHQHWDLLTYIGYGWEYFTGRATAYLTRVKNPELDPSKAGHFIDKLVWLIDHGYVPGTFVPTTTPRINLESYLQFKYFPANGIVSTSLEARAIRAILSARTREHLRTARDICSQLEAGVSAASNGPHHRAIPEPHNEPVAAWAFPNEPTGRGYVEQDSPTPSTFSTGGGGDYAGAGATASWKPDTAAEEHANRTFVYGDSAIAAASHADNEESSRSHSSSSSYDSGSSSDSSSSSGGSSGSD